MALVVFCFIALAGMVVSYALGQGGPVAGLVFFTILFVGVCFRIAQPILEKLKP